MAQPVVAAVGRLLAGVNSLLTPRHVIWLWLAVEVVLHQLQIFGEPSASFDWDAYMEQVHRMVNGHPLAPWRWNFNYADLRGDTGPLVYPAGHTAIHLAAYAVTGWDPVHWTTEYVPKPIPGYEARTVRPHGLLLGIQQWYGLVYIGLLIAAWKIHQRAGMVRVCVW